MVGAGGGGGGPLRVGYAAVSVVHCGRWSSHGSLEGHCVGCLELGACDVEHGTDLSAMKLKSFLGTGVEYGIFLLDLLS